MAQPNNQPARPTTPGSGRCACGPPASGSTRSGPTPAASPPRTPASRCASPSPCPTHLRRRLEIEADGLQLELHAAVGETIDSAIVWLPERRTASDQQSPRTPLPALPEPQHPAGGPLPLRRALPRERAHAALPAARSPRHRTTRPDRRRGADRRLLARLHDAVDYVHHEGPRGFNAGTDSGPLWRRSRCPPDSCGQGYGKVSWAVRTLWESYVGWFRLQSTTELYPDSTGRALAELTEEAGTEAVLARAEAALARVDPVSWGDPY